jgi:hypothetical protein
MAMVNKFSHAGQSRGLLITWAQEITAEAFALDPIFMEECAIKVFGHPVWSWTATETTETRIHAICRAAMLVRLRGGQAS